MNSMFRRAAAMVLAGIMGGALLTGCGSTKIDGSKTVMTVNDEAVRLGVASFYTKYQQAQIYKYYSQMLGSSGIFDTSIADSSDPSVDTYGESMKKTALEDVEKMVVMAQHADEFGVKLTDEEKKAIDQAAQDYIDKNQEEIRGKIGADKEDIVRLLELQTIQSKMMDPLVKDVDTKVTQEESQQSKVTYVAVDTADAASGASSTKEAAESTPEGPDEKAQKNADAVLKAVLAEADPAAADLDAIAKKVDSSLSAVEGHYTTSDTTDGSVDSAVVDAVKDLKEGTVVDHVITGSNGKTLYVARFDLKDDETYTATKKESIVRSRKQDEFDKVTDGWLKDAKIKVDQKVWKTVTLSDKDPVTLKDPESGAAGAQTAAEGSLNGSSNSAAEAVSEASSTPAA
jgi:foldase protein PrsA